MNDISKLLGVLCLTHLSPTIKCLITIGIPQQILLKETGAMLTVGVYQPVPFQILAEHALQQLSNLQPTTHT